MIVGTAAYMSPEQAQGRRVDARSDIFSFGSVLYEMVTGRRAFSRESTVSTLAAILKEEPRPPSELVPAVPRELERLIQHCMRKDPARRFQHMDDVRTLLEQLREDSESGELSAAAPPSPRSPFFWLAAVGLAMAVLVVVVAAWLWRRPTAPAPEAPSVATPFTTSPGFEVQPTFSPDGNEIAFAWNGEKEDNYDIYRKLIGPGEPLRLTRDPAWDYSPAWSPDGRIDRVPAPAGPGPAGIYLIPALGGAERRLADIAAIPGWNTGIAWTADNKRLIVSDHPSRRARRPFPAVLRKRRAATTDVRPAANAGGFLGSAVGRLGSCALAGRANARLHPRGRQRQRRRSPASPRPGHDSGGLARAPDLREPRCREPHLAVRCERDPVFPGRPEGERQILRLAAVPAGPDAVAGRPGVARDGCDEPGLLPSLGAARLQSHAARRQHLPPGAARAGGTCWRTGTADRLDAPRQHPDYSPKGDAVAFMSTRSGSTEIWLSNADGSNPRQLTSMEGPLTANPRWSPDGTTILFDSRRRARPTSMSSPREASPRRLTDHPSSKAKRAGLATANGSTSARIGRVEARCGRSPRAGGEATQVTRNGGTCLRISGRPVALLRQTPQVRPLEGPQLAARRLASWRT